MKRGLKDLHENNWDQRVNGRESDEGVCNDVKYRRKSDKVEAVSKAINRQSNER